ncbi:hypothetical protein H0H92_000609 [Tricholoma furcatifolium]|nr:hypothetical protein H0H92_000609 [Tricholoma furcatifolium]
MDPQFSSYPYPTFSPQLPDAFDEPASSIPVGTFLHKGFYDLLAMIPTPSPSRLIWGNSSQVAEYTVAGPRYENIGPSPTRAAPPAASAKKGRRVSKDMVSKPTGFVHLIHASDADQLEALLTRWGPDGLGKLGDPRWANPIKNRVRQTNQERAAYEAKPKPLAPPKDEWYDELPRGELRVVNGMSTTTTSSLLTTAAGENVVAPSYLEGLPGRPGNSTFRWGALKVHPEIQENEEYASSSEPLEFSQQAPVPRTIIPSLATLDKAVSARIYFENLYFPLFRHPPSREQRRLAMENDMTNMNLSQTQKEHLRARWRQNETDYLRERRRKVDASAFVKLKTIGHGAFGVVSLVKEKSTGNLYAMKQLRKIDMLRKGQEGHVRAERDILKSASMVNSLSGAEWIILEYMGGGDLLNLLIEKDVFDEDFTRFYVAEMILAIESCHKLGFIHRDIKPDTLTLMENFKNFLFDPKGHIRLSDFGLATDLHWAHDTSYYEQQRLHLLHKHGIDLEDSNGIADGKGTRRMSRKDVELLMGNGEGREGVFTWREKHRKKLAYSMWVILYFESIQLMPYKDAVRIPIIFPDLVGMSIFTKENFLSAMSPGKKFSIGNNHYGFLHALECLMQESPEDRLGSQGSSSANSIAIQARRNSFLIPQDRLVTGNDGADLIKALWNFPCAHDWFHGIDWKNIHRYPAPYSPELRNPEDTRHFDDDIPPEPLAPANGAPADATRDIMLQDKVHGEQILQSRKALAFAGFTHKSPRAISYLRADIAFNPLSDSYGQNTIRGRPSVRETRELGKGRAISV